MLLSLNLLVTLADRIFYASLELLNTEPVTSDMNDNLTRFSDRVENYLRFRPDYPAEVVEIVLGARVRDASCVVVDLGSGTGKLSKLFIDRGIRTVGVEPNKEMREAAASLFVNHTVFESVDGTAEDTGLGDACADFVTMGQALHWFRLDAAREECKRILKPGGKVSVVYNERSVGSPLLQDYEGFLHSHAKDYANVTHRNIDDAAFAAFFGSKNYELFKMENFQLFDFKGFLGRYSSSSYSYKEGDREYCAAREALFELFEKYQEDGCVRFEYETKVYLGSIEG